VSPSSLPNPRRLDAHVDDISWVIDSLADQTFFAKHTEGLKQEDLDILSALSARWREHLSAGRFKLSVPLDTPIGKVTDLGGFWTTQYPYQLIPEKDPKLLKELQKSDLVILKGDLNYRKCVSPTIFSLRKSVADEKYIYVRADSSPMASGTLPRRLTPR
jgi:hypothetical protein